MAADLSPENLRIGLSSEDPIGRFAEMTLLFGSSSSRLTYRRRRGSGIKNAVRSLSTRAASVSFRSKTQRLPEIFSTAAASCSFVIDRSVFGTLPKPRPPRRMEALSRRGIFFESADKLSERVLCTKTNASVKRPHLKKKKKKRLIAVLPLAVAAGSDFCLNTAFW